MKTVGTHDPAGRWIRNRDENVRTRIAVAPDTHHTLLVVRHRVKQSFVQGLLRQLGVYFRKVSRNVTHACDGAVLEKTRVVVLGALCLVGAPRVLRKDFVCDGVGIPFLLLFRRRTLRILCGVFYHCGSKGDARYLKPGLS